MQKTALRAAGAVFLTVGVLHVWRVLAKAVVTVGQATLPAEWSITGAAIAFGLSAWMFSAAKSK